jgi:hypothetical protein
LTLKRYFHCWVQTQARSMLDRDQRWGGVLFEVFLL